MVRMRWSYKPRIGLKCFTFCLLLAAIFAVICVVLPGRLSQPRVPLASDNVHLFNQMPGPPPGVTRTTEAVDEFVPDDVKASNVTGNIAYCNSPTRPVTGSEGTVPKGFKLKMVHVFIRHGDRTPIHNIHGYKQDQYSCRVNRSLGGNDTKVQRFAATMEYYTGKQKSTDHFKNWALMPNKDVCGMSELTALGALQHVKNGQYLSEKYIRQSTLFNPGINIEAQVHTKSTTTSRTYQSAIAFLYGFLPNFNVTNSEIMAVEDHQFCSTNVRGLVKNCYCKTAGQEKLAVKHESKSKSTGSSNGKTNYRQIRSAVADVFDLKEGQVPAVNSLLDIFVPPVCHSKPVPCSDTGKCINGKLYHQLWTESYKSSTQISEKARKHSFRSSSLTMYPVLVEMAFRLKDAIEGREFLRFVLYSGHDITLSPLLIALGMDDGKWSPYASRVVVELYETMPEKSARKYYLRFLYNGRDLTEDVTFCRGKTFRGFCKFRLFYDYVFSGILQQFGHNSHHNACNEPPLKPLDD